MLILLRAPGDHGVLLMDKYQKSNGIGVFIGVALGFAVFVILATYVYFKKHGG